MIALLFVFALASTPEFTLPPGVTPLKHIIEMTIDPGAETLTGVARIDLTLSAQTRTIWLNGRDLTITKAWVEERGRIVPASTEVAGGEFIGVTPEVLSGPGLSTVVLQYTAPLSATAVAGPNRKKVDDEWYVFTTFTPTDARRAFPCFDEPRFKTPWEMSIRVRREHRAFSNAPMVKETDEPNGMKLVRFASTSKMAAEVVAFAVGPFDVYEGGTAGIRGTPIRVITAKGQSALGKDAAIATSVVLPRLEKYTGIPYPWDKLDHVALPQGAFGAVENPGLITYQSRSLLVPPATTQSVRRIETHEIGHQWFGNLVTQSDWTDVWLSEGFATWITFKLTDEDEPADRRRISAVMARERIMIADNGPTTHPVRVEMHNRKELDTVYNQFPYQKGGAILMMVEAWLGEERFQHGLRKYLADHRLGNASTRDLEAELPPEAAPVFDAMLNSTGVPTVAAKCVDGKLTFERHGPGPVPVCWKSNAGSMCTTSDPPPGTVCPSWIYPNANGAGYYRVVWTPEQLRALQLGRLNGAERLTLVFDLHAQKLDDPILKELSLDPNLEILTNAMRKADQ